MKKNILIIILLLTTILSCNFSSQKLPDGILNQKRFTKMLTDMQIAQASISFQRNQGNQDYKKYSEPYYRSVFEKYNLDEESFKKNMTFYEKDPKNLLKIYQNVQLNLDSIQESLKDTTMTILKPENIQLTK
ncbi:MAG: DUF4296 domain-containing protein [Bacteroidales bacterium]